MKYTEEIFNILSKGGFISSNSVSTQVKRLYDAIEEDLPDYYDYYKGIGFYLEGGDGYYYFTRKESKVDLERKLEAIQKWIDYLSFLKTYHSAFGPGFLFRAADIEIQIGCDIVQSPNQKIPNRKTKCVIETHLNIKQNVILGANLKPV